MKTLTLSEAFSSATQGPLCVELGTHQPPKIVPLNDGKPVAILAACHTSEQEAHNAALLAHCFNHFQEVTEQLKAMVGMVEFVGLSGPPELEKKVNTTMALARAAIAKANQMILP